MPFASQNTVAITLQANGCVLNFIGLGDPGPTHKRLWALLSGSQQWIQVSSTVTRRKIKPSFDLKLFNKALHTDALSQKKIIFWPKTLQQGAAYWCSGCHLLIAKGFGDPTGC